jgi:hypothetical protein
MDVVPYFLFVLRRIDAALGKRTNSRTGKAVRNVTTVSRRREVNETPLCDQPRWNHIRHRCCCVFDNEGDGNGPLSECKYHADFRADNERLRGLLREALEHHLGPLPLSIVDRIDAALAGLPKQSVDETRAVQPSAARIKLACCAECGRPWLIGDYYCSTCGSRHSTADKP